MSKKKKDITDRGFEIVDIKEEEIDIGKDYDLDPGQTAPRKFVTTITIKSPFSGN